MNALSHIRVNRQARRPAARRLEQAVLASVEPLEARVFLSAVTYSVSGPGDHALLMQLQGSNLVISDNGVVEFSGDFSSVSSVSIVGGAGNDVLTIDASSGSPVPSSGGMSFDGAGGSNQLVLQGGSFGFEVYAPTSGTSGNISIGGGNIGYANVGDITDTSSVLFFTLDTSAGDEQVNIVDGPVVNGLQTTHVDGGASPQFAATDFANKRNATVNTINGFDTVTLNNPAASAAMSSFTVDTNEGADVINVLATPDGMTTTITSNAFSTLGNDTVTVGNAGSVQNILGTLLITNSSGLNDVLLDDSADATGRVATLNCVQDPNLGTMVLGVSGFAPGLVEVDPIATNTLTVNGGSGGNTFNVMDDAVGALNYLNSGAGNDVVNVAFLPGNSPLTIDGEGGNDAVNVNISVNNGYPSILGVLTVNNHGGATALTVDTTAETSAQSVTLNNRQVMATTTLPTGTTNSFIDYNLAFGSLSVKTGTAADTFNVNQTNLPTTLDGGGAGDSYLVSMPGLGDTLSILDSGTDGSDTASLTGFASGTSYQVGPTQTLGGWSMVNYDANLEALSLTAGSGNDSVTVTPSVTTTFNIDGGGPTTLPGDALSLQPAGAADAELTLGPATGQGNYAFSNRQPVNFVNIERLGVSADLSLSLTAPQSVVEGGALTYGFTVTNNGPGDATNVLLNAALPADVTFVSSTSGQGTSALSGGSVSFNLGTIASGARVTGTITVVAGDEGSTESVSASASSDASDPNLNDNAASVSPMVTDAPITATGGFALAGVEGQMSPTITVATFADAGVAESLSDYQAVITWGDNSSSAGTITYDAQSNTFTVTGSHAYAEEGAYTASVVISHDTAAPVTVTDAVSVSDPAVIATGGLSLAAAEGASGTFTLATFTDPGGAENVSDYVATINWGDQTSSVGTVTFDAASGRFTVTGSHLYAAEGNFTANVSVAHDAALAATVSDSMSVSDPSVVGTGGFQYSLVEGGSLSAQTVATFTDPGGADSLSDYSASITWGDSSAASAGTITFNAGTGVFSVAGSHLFATAGNYTATVTLHHAAATDVQVTDTIVVTDPAVVMIGGKTLSATEGAMSASQVVATFTDPGGAESVSHYSANINWGDGSNSAGTISFNAGTGVFSVAGSHLYATAASFPLSVVVQHDSAPDANAASTAMVSDPSVVATGGLTLNSTPNSSTGTQTLATFTDPGGAEGLSHYSATIAWGDGSSGAGTILFNSATGEFTVQGAHTYGGPGGYTVSVTIHHDTATDVTVTDLAKVASKGAPKISNLAASSINEGGTTSLTGKISSPGGGGAMTLTVNWGPGQASSTYSLPANANSFSVSHKYLDNPAAPSTSYPMSLTLSNANGSSTASGSALVSNVAPTAGALTGPTAVVRGQSFDLAGSFADPGVLDTHTVKFNWDDGSTSPGTVTESNGSGTFTAGHVFTASGTYNVVCTITDKDGGTTTVKQTITVSAILVENDPVYGGTMLAIGGTTGNDKIDVKSNHGANNLKVTVNSDSANVTSGVGRIVVFAQAGNDSVQFAKDVMNPVFAYGGAGNDTMSGGGGADVFVGGDGNDLLMGGSSRNILIGGRGSDMLLGGAADDILVAGYTSLDNSDAALAAVFNEWTRATVPVATRIAHLSNGGGLNGPVVLNTGSVFNDNAPDLLMGNGGSDWMLSSSNDVIVGRTTGVVRTKR